MKQRRLLWKVYPYYFIVIAIALVLAAFYASYEMSQLYTAEITNNLVTRARLISEAVRPSIINSDKFAIDKKCKELGKLTETRITIVDTFGVVIGDSEKDPLGMDNHGSRPEIVQAYGGEPGTATRYSNTLQLNMKYIALPVLENNQIIAIVRTSLPLSSIKETLNSFYINAIIGGVIIIILAAIISTFIFRKLTDPLKDLQIGAERFAKGNFDSKLPITDINEFATLAQSMNFMAEQLDRRIRTIVEQRNEKEAILSGMSEGVLTLDAKERIVSLNRAAADLLDIDIENAMEKSIHEVVRVADLHELINKALKSISIIEKVIEIHGNRDLFLQVYAKVLNDSQNEFQRVILVFTDLTKMKKLENIRKDFVANVTHELKTPITAIIGSVETILDGAIDNPDDCDRFLKMIDTSSNRLNILVDDLLTLARLESDFEHDKLDLSPGKIDTVLKSSILACQEKANSRDIDITCSCNPEIKAKINSRQVEQAVINLIDNAIKYSETGSQISITVDRIGDEIVISVEDRGCGIENKHLARLFERFYRADKAQSREVGGTGLGLAIVKHIALTHGGRVSVDSTFRKGSTFRIHLPTIN